MSDLAAVHRHTPGGETTACLGTRLVFRYAAGDSGMRNLAVVALTEASVARMHVTDLFGLPAEYASRLRAPAFRAGGSQGGRWARDGGTRTQIAHRYKGARSVISGLLARLGSAPVQETFGPTRGEPGPGPDPAAEVSASPGEADEGSEVAPGVASPLGSITALERPAATAPADGTAPTAHPAGLEPLPSEPAAGTGLARLGIGEFATRYAWVSLHYPYLAAMGADAIFATLTGSPSCRYNVAILVSARVGFALRIDTMQGVEHVRRAGAGSVLEVIAVPALPTLRLQMAALADGSDPLGLERAVALGMLPADVPIAHVYFVEDHFMSFAGARRVAKGYLTKQPPAEPARADAPIIDECCRAVVFTAGEPTGLTRSFPAALVQLRSVLGPDAPVLLGFDRGGASPVTFRALRAAGLDWVTYGRGKLAPVTALVQGSWTHRDGRRVSLGLADESVEMGGYGPARQLTLFEGGTAVLEVLASDTRSVGAALVCWLRSRRWIETMLAHSAEQGGIDAIATYLMDTGPGEATVANPARLAARPRLACAETALADAERALAQVLTGSTASPRQINAAFPTRRRTVERAHVNLERARTALAPIPARGRLSRVTRRRSGPGYPWRAAGCRWSSACSPTTPSRLWPSTSAPIRSISMSIERACVTCSAWAGASPKPSVASPSPWVGRTAPGSPRLLSSSSRSSTPPRPTCPWTATRSPSRSPIGDHN
ncbi:MAG: metallophosphoesterase family protein [Mycobacteriales bacterium]